MDGNFTLVKFRGSLGLDSKIIYCERKWREGEKDPACKMDGLRTVKGKCFSLFFFVKRMNEHPCIFILVGMLFLLIFIFASLFISLEYFFWNVHWKFDGGSLREFFNLVMRRLCIALPSRSNPRFQREIFWEKNRCNCTISRNRVIK